MHLIRNVESLDGWQQSSVDITIEKDNALFYYLKHLTETLLEVCEKFHDICAKGYVIFITDTYLRNSIKSVESKRRGESKKYVVSGMKTRWPRDWSTFLKNDRNTALLYKAWTSKEFASE